MIDLIMFLVEMISISAVLYLLYVVAFRKKASYLSQRVLLLSIPLIATALAFVSEDVVALHMRSESPLKVNVVEEIVEPTQSSAESVVTATDEGFRVIRGVDEVVSRRYDIRAIALSLWIAITTALFIRFMSRFNMILSLRRLSERERCGDHTIYRSNIDGMLFSFWRGVYIYREMSGEKFDFVMRHELSHIRCNHYIDKLIIELYSMLLWFNPILYLIRREVSLIQEYEADNTVLRSGCDETRYKMYIFEEVTSHTPAFANGLNSSQIKKRFITMKNGYKVSHRALRVLLTTATLVVVTLSSLVYVSAQTTNDGTAIDSRLNFNPNDVKSVTVKDGVITITKTNGEVIINDHSANKSTKYYTPSNQWPYIIKENVASLNVNEAGDAVVLAYKDGRQSLYKLDGITPDEIKKVSIVSQLVAIKKHNGEIWSFDDNKWQLRAPNVRVNRSQYCLARGENNEDIYVVRFKDHTKVYLRTRVIGNDRWYVLSKDMALIDPLTKDRYMIHSAKGGFPLGVVAIILNEKDEDLYFEMIFPPLDKSINRVTFSETIDPSVTIGYNVALNDRGWQFKDVKVQTDLPYFASEKYQAEINRKPREIRLESFSER